jgi:CheY-like chemotaxis protein
VLPQEPSLTTVLLVEREPRLRAALSECLGGFGCSVICVTDAEGAFSALEQENDVQVLVADIDAQEADEGLPFVRQVHERWPALGLVITSGRLRRLRPEEVPGDGCFVPRPIPAQMLADLVHVAAHQRPSPNEEIVPP